MADANESTLIYAVTIFKSCCELAFRRGVRLIAFLFVSGPWKLVQVCCFLFGLVLLEICALSGQIKEI